VPSPRGSVIKCCYPAGREARPVRPLSTSTSTSSFTSFLLLTRRGQAPAGLIFFSKKAGAGYTKLRRFGKISNMLTALCAILLAVLPSGNEWQDNQLLSFGKEPSRAAFSSFVTEESALRILPEFSERTLSLDSDTEWKFCWSKDPSARPVDFYKVAFDVSSWATIKVPCSWQAMGADGKGGWGTALYTNVPYPFKKDAPGGSQVMLEPPKHFTNYAARNPVGSYRRDFELPDCWQETGDVFLKFDGVDAFFYLWVNGEYVGFSKDSRSPAEFNVTKFIKPGKNTLALEVYRYSDGSYLEDQDMFRLSGIFRHTWLLSRPKSRIQDFHVTARPVVKGDLKGAWEMTVQGVGLSQSWSVALYTFEDQLVARTSSTNAELKLVVSSPKLWSAEEPNCYKVVLFNGAEYVSTIFGFRVSEMREINGVKRYYFNGQPIKLKGANRHETDPMFGHFVPKDRHEQDIRQMKEANCNTVRNAHYPQDDYWYYLCDTKGLYVVDEANVESHGYGYGADSISHQKSWEKATVDRNLSMIARNFNHPSIIIWSYGNESGPGENFQAVEKAVKAVDTTRPTHYERDWSVADMDGCQYPAVDWCWWKAAQKDSKKPFYISEYAHNMANAMGNLKDYQDAIESSDVILGATIWDWVDQGLWKDVKGKREKGESAENVRILAFGGDFGDQPNDGLFCMNGCVLSDRNLEPGYWEIQHVYQNWTAFATNDYKKLVIKNKNYFVDSSCVTCGWKLFRNGVPYAAGAFALDGLKPLESAVFSMPPIVDEARARGGVVALRVTFLKDSATIAEDQIDFPLEKIAPRKTRAGKVGFSETEKAWVFATKKADISFCKKTGMPFSIRTRGFLNTSELLKTPMRLDAYRSPSSNEVSFGVRLGDTWAALGLSELVGTCVSSEHEECADGAQCLTTVVEWKGAKFLKVQGHNKSSVSVTEMNPPMKPVTFVVATEWKIYLDGTIDCTAKIRPMGETIELARIGFSYELNLANPKVRWFGRGPFENYRDRKSGAFIGLWSATANEFFVPYARNEDCGNREDTYGFKVGDMSVRTLGAPFAFEVNPYNPLELLLTVHPPELKPSEKTFVGVFAETRGLGGQSCGPAPMPRDILRTDRDYDLSFMIAFDGDDLTPLAGEKASLPPLPEVKNVHQAKVALCSSSEPGEGKGEYAIDGNLDTMWHTQYTGTQGNFPHILAVELAQVETLKGLRFYARQQGLTGRVKACTIETSMDGETWSAGVSATLENTEKPQDILFAAPVQAKFYRFTAHNNHDGSDNASMAEIEIIK